MSEPKKCAFCGVIFVPTANEKTCPECYQRVSQMGRKGGEATKAKYGNLGYYGKIGKRGGRKVKIMMAIARDALKIEPIEEVIDDGKKAKV